MIAWMVVQVSYCRVKAHSGEQLAKIGFWFHTHTPDFICKQNVGPVPPGCRVVITLQQGQRADPAVAPVTVFCPVPVETAH